ncbi:hypothetical protein FRB90_006921 [Tulasnella sp. 427]|nr:hypothetical protein FRB90_006921 [Tulasnella sp. 427]
MTDKKDKKPVLLTVPASFTNFNTAFNPSFGNGSTAFGVLATDAISVGSLSVMNRPFEVITCSSGKFDGPNSRLMGFTFAPSLR